MDGKQMNTIISNVQQMTANAKAALSVPAGSQAGGKRKNRKSTTRKNRKSHRKGSRKAHRKGTRKSHRKGTRKGNRK